MENRLVFISFSTIFIAIISYVFLDISLAFYFHDISNNSQYLFNYLTILGDSSWILTSSLLLFIILRKKNIFWSQRFLFIFVSILTSGIVVNLLKIIFSRIRPRGLFNESYQYGFNILSFKIENFFASFPSGHATTALGFATALAILFPRYTIIFLIIGCITAFSRVVLTEHFLSDILIGGLLGGLLSVYINTKYFKFNSKLGSSNDK